MTHAHHHALEAEHLTKRFDAIVALDDVSFTVPRGRVVGLMGRNGSGKTTLLRCLQGLTMPTSGRAMMLGKDGIGLGDAELARIGVVHQQNRFLPWMTGQAHLDFVRSFYATWDSQRSRDLVEAFDLDLSKVISSMSPGEVQKLAIVTGVCHRPEVLLLDEPAASIDPPSREALFTALFEMLREDSPAIVISSHQLDDIERSVDWVLCMDRGRIVCNDALDALQERYAQWRVLPTHRSDDAGRTVGAGSFESAFREPWIRDAEVERGGAVLLVEGAEDEREAFEQRHGVIVQSQPVRLSQMFRLWTTRGGGR
jgi:ABC-2 type transport system ATP-binding protein